MKNKIAEFGKLLYDKDLTSATSGNISIRSERGVYITASGTMLGFLKESDIVEIDMDGREIEPNKKASSEKFMHLAIYKKRPDIKAIIHCHAPFATAFAACRKEIEKPIAAETILYFGKIPVADYALPSSTELVNNTAVHFDKYDTVLMANHGIVAGASELLSAFCKIETAETYAKTYIYSKLIGTPVMLSGVDIRALEELKESLKH